MARGAQFLALITAVRAELRRSVSPAVGVQDLDNIKQVINRVYATLYNEHDWPHLRKVFPRIALAEGQRYYDFPAGLNVERVERAAVWYSDTPHVLNRGISFEEYAGFDTEQTEPALAWDVRWTGSSDQIEIWPVPSADDSQELEFIGLQEAPALVNDIDVCLLDDQLIILFASAEIAAASGGKDAQIKLSAAQQYFNTLKNRTKGGLRSYRNGLTSNGGGARPGQVILRVR